MNYDEWIRSMIDETLMETIFIDQLSGNIRISQYMKKPHKNLTMYIREDFPRDVTLIIDTEFDNLKVISEDTNYTVTIQKPINGMFSIQGARMLNIESQLFKPFKLLYLTGTARLKVDMLNSDVKAIHAKTHLTDCQLLIKNVQYTNIKYDKIKDDEVLISGRYEDLTVKPYTFLEKHVDELYDFFS